MGAGDADIREQLVVDEQPEGAVVGAEHTQAVGDADEPVAADRRRRRTGSIVSRRRRRVGRRMASGSSLDRSTCPRRPALRRGWPGAGNEGRSCRGGTRVRSGACAPPPCQCCAHAGSHAVTLIGVRFTQPRCVAASRPQARERRQHWGGGVRGRMPTAGEARERSRDGQELVYAPVLALIRRHLAVRPDPLSRNGPLPSFRHVRTHDVVATSRPGRITRTMETLVDLLEGCADRYGDRSALGLRRDDGTRFHWSYREVRRRSRLAAWRLRALGLQPGDRVLTWSPVDARAARPRTSARCTRG